MGLVVEGVVLAAGEGAEGGEDELVVTKPEDVGAKAGAGAVFDAGGGVEVAAEVEAVGLVEDFVGVVEDVEAVDSDFWEERVVGSERLFSTGGIVIAFDESDGPFFEPGKELFEDFGGAADFGVEDIAGDDEVGGVCLFEEGVDASEVAGGVAFRDGEAAGAEGGGFAEVGVGEDEGAGVGEEEGFVGEEGDGSGWEVEGHGEKFEHRTSKVHH